MKSLGFVVLALVLTAPAAWADPEAKKQVSALLEQNGVDAQVFDAFVYVTVGCFGSDHDQCIGKAQQVLARGGFAVELRNGSLVVKSKK